MTDDPAFRSVLFADIAGSTSLLRELGDVDGGAVITTALEQVQVLMEAFGGRVVERTGDELLCLFDEPSAAADAAAAVHLSLSDAAATKELPGHLRVRIGFLHGAVVERAEGVAGSTVHGAARLCALAKAGQTLTSKPVLDRLRGDLRRASRFFDTVTLKGITGEHQVHELIWTPTATGVRHPRERTSAVGIELRYGSDTWRVSGTQPYLELGRHPACGLRVEGEAVSHLHARLIWSRGQIRLEDVSTNGTIVQPEHGPPRVVHHDQAELVGRGVLRLGAADDDSLVACVEYQMEEGTGLRK